MSIGLTGKLLILFVAAVWLINGLFCKVLNLVSRHQTIVGKILGNKYSGIETKIIGCLEILMALWVVSGIQRGWCTIMQILLVAAMNIIEFLFAQELLLFGRFNIVIAALFIGVLIANYSIFK